MDHGREDYDQRIQDSEHKIPEDMPVFLFLASDREAPKTLRYWAFQMDAHGINGQIRAAVARHQANKMEEWQRVHGCHVADV